MFCTYERVNAAAANGAVCRGDDGEYFFAGYELAELSRRVGVEPGTLQAWSRACGRGPRYAAIDVVRFETMARLVCAGVPVARAAVLLAAAEPTRDLTFSGRAEPSKSQRPGPDWTCHDTVTMKQRSQPVEPQRADAAPRGAATPAQD